VSQSSTDEAGPPQIAGVDVERAQDAVDVDVGARQAPPAREQRIGLLAAGVRRTPTRRPPPSAALGPRRLKHLVGYATPGRTDERFDRPDMRPCRRALAGIRRGVAVTAVAR